LDFDQNFLTELGNFNFMKKVSYLAPVGKCYSFS